MTTFVPGRSGLKETRADFLDRYPAHCHEDRPREIEIDGAIWTEQIDVDAARPHPEIGKAAAGQFAHQRRRRHHSHRGGGMKASQRAIDQALGMGERAAMYSEIASYSWW